MKSPPPISRRSLKYKSSKINRITQTETRQKAHTGVAGKTKESGRNKYHSFFFDKHTQQTNPRGGGYRQGQPGPMVLGKGGGGYRHGIPRATSWHRSVDHAWDEGKRALERERQTGAFLTAEGTLTLTGRGDTPLQAKPEPEPEFSTPSPGRGFFEASNPGKGPAQREVRPASSSSPPNSLTMKLESSQGSSQRPFPFFLAVADPRPPTPLGRGERPLGRPSAR